MSNAKQGISSTWRKRLESWGQNFLLAIPLLSEIRLGKDRVMAFLRAWHFISRAKIEGDYLEFGVMEGMSFKLSLRAASRCLAKKTAGGAPPPRFFAFDSFEGLPAPDEQRDGEIWQAGDCYSTRATFEKNIRRAAQGWQVEVVEGYYDQTLSNELADRLQLTKAAFIAIDCDLYDSTIQALRFATSMMQTGTIIYFDDWYFSHGDMTLGEAGACADWLTENPGVSLTDYGDVGIMGKCFLVQRTGRSQKQTRANTQEQRLELTNA